MSDIPIKALIHRDTYTASHLHGTCPVMGCGSSANTIVVKRGVILLRDAGTHMCEHLYGVRLTRCAYFIIRASLWFRPPA